MKSLNLIIICLLSLLLMTACGKSDNNYEHTNAALYYQSFVTANNGVTSGKTLYGQRYSGGGSGPGYQNTFTPSNSAFKLVLDVNHTFGIYPAHNDQNLTGPFAGAYTQAYFGTWKVEGNQLLLDNVAVADPTQGSNPGNDWQWGMGLYSNYDNSGFSKDCMVIEFSQTVNLARIDNAYYSNGNYYQGNLLGIEASEKLRFCITPDQV
ncbi:MAG: hypothetical protein ISR65_20030 [Bacteriovoracaceae bacterium]|nr:hypothetical protein [Bacteriovoracaceae bacterium]